MKWTKKVKWFTGEDFRSSVNMMEYTHVYVNYHGNPVKCIITDNRFKMVMVLNENGCTVLLDREKLSEL